MRRTPLSCSGKSEVALPSCLSSRANPQQWRDHVTFEVPSETNSTLKAPLMLQFVRRTLRGHRRHVVVRTAVEVAARLAFSHASPLLEEERHVASRALVANGFDPTLIQRMRPPRRSRPQR